MNIHIFNSENLYSFTFLSFLERNFDLSSSKIVFRKKRSTRFNYSHYLNDRIIYTGNNFEFYSKLFAELKKTSGIFFHQLPYGPSLFVLNLFYQHLSKATWIIWGGDLYTYEQGNESPVKFVYELLRKRIIQKIPRIAALIPGDFDLALKIYKPEAVFLQVAYPPPLDFFNYSGSADNSLQKDEVRILIGNSGNSSNNHLEILSKLRLVKDSNIRIFCPLSYSGDLVYINHVVNRGSELFGNKFVPLLNIIEPAKYLDLLWKTDIAIMNHKRQQGLGNILPLLYFRKKVFIRSDTTTFHYLAGIGCRLFDILTIDTFDDSSLSVDNGELIANQEIIGNLLAEKNCIRMWEQILNQQKRCFEN